jgi:hypothetical protein
MNTLTNAIYGMEPHSSLFSMDHMLKWIDTVVYGAHGLRRVQPREDGGLFSTLAFPYWGLIGVGVLSAWFHATLKYHSQMGDDLSMFLAVGSLLHQLLCFEATPAQRTKYTVAILGSLIPVSVYHVWADEIYVHEIVFAIMVFLVSRRTRALIKRQIKSEESKKRLGSMATFGICVSVLLPAFVRCCRLTLAQRLASSATSSGPLTSTSVNTSRLSNAPLAYLGAFSSNSMVGGTSSPASGLTSVWRLSSILLPLRKARVVGSRMDSSGLSKLS